MPYINMINKYGEAYDLYDKRRDEANTFILGLNRFNAEDYTRGKSQNSAGEIKNNSACFLTDFIPIMPGGTYSVSHVLGSASYCNCFFAEDKATVVGYYVSNGTPPRLMKAPDNAAYIRATGPYASINDFEVKLEKYSAAYYKKIVESMPREYVTPEMYGAKGDGETDDTAALTAALATGKITLLSGTYSIQSGITLLPTNSVMGVGGGAKIMQQGLPSASGVTVLFYGVENAEISNLTIDYLGDDAAQDESKAMYGILGIVGCKNIAVKNMKSSAFYFSQIEDSGDVSRNIRFENLHMPKALLSANTGDGVYFENCLCNRLRFQADAKNITVSNCRFKWATCGTNAVFSRCEWADTDPIRDATNTQNLTLTAGCSVIVLSSALKKINSSSYGGGCYATCIDCVLTEDCTLDPRVAYIRCDMQNHATVSTTFIQCRNVAISSTNKNSSAYYDNKTVSYTYPLDAAFREWRTGGNKTVKTGYDVIAYVSVIIPAGTAPQVIDGENRFIIRSLGSTNNKLKPKEEVVFGPWTVMTDGKITYTVDAAPTEDLYLSAAIPWQVASELISV